MAGKGERIDGRWQLGVGRERLKDKGGRFSGLILEYWSIGKK